MIPSRATFLFSSNVMLPLVLPLAVKTSLAPTISNPAASVMLMLAFVAGFAGLGFAETLAFAAKVVLPTVDSETPVAPSSRSSPTEARLKVVLVPVPVSVRVRAPLLATTLPLKVVLPLVFSVTVLPDTAPLKVVPEAAVVVKVVAPLLVSAATETAPVLASVMFSTPDAVVALTLFVLTFRAVVPPRLPLVAVRLTLLPTLELVSIVAAPVMLPPAVVRLTELVEAVLPRVAPLSVIPPVPALVLIEIEVAVASVGVTVTPVADCNAKEPVVPAAVSARGSNVPVPVLRPRLSTLTSPVELAVPLEAIDNVPVSTRRAVVELPTELELLAPVVMVSVLPSTKSEPVATASVIVPEPVAVRETTPDVVLLANKFPSRLMLPLLPVFFKVTEVTALTVPVVLMPVPAVLALNVVPAAAEPMLMAAEPLFCVRTIAPIASSVPKLLAPSVVIVRAPP